MRSQWIRPTVRQMDGYTPGEQPPQKEQYIKLNTNENPFPPSIHVLRAISQVPAEALRRYPDPTCAAFGKVAAKVHGVTPDMITCGNGSDDVLAYALGALAGPEQTLAFPDPTYSLYPVLAKLAEVKPCPVPWDEPWQLPTKQLLQSGAQTIFLANPNAPSGTLTPIDAIAELLRRFQGVVLVDEAYADFAGVDCVKLLKTHANLLICRTLSKGYSLAGLRFGYAIGAADLIAQINKARDSYPCDAIAQAAAVAALQDRAHARASWKYVAEERKRMAGELTKRHYRVIPSAANFLLVEPPSQKAAEIYQYLKSHKVLVRYFPQPGLDKMLRITIGVLEHNDILLQTLDNFLESA